MKLFYVVLSVAILQLLGVACAFFVANTVDPTFNERLQRQKQLEHSYGCFQGGPSEQMLLQYFNLHLVGYLPFLFASGVVLFKHRWQLLQKLSAVKNILPVFSGFAVCIFTVLMFSGVVYDWLVEEANPKWSFALIGGLFGVGIFGFYCVYSAKNRKQPYVLFGLGAATIFLTFLILEMLLITGFGK